ncbi:carbohydrate binding domain-containing protein [Candidatus Omnitrophota bacterium]
MQVIADEFSKVLAQTVREYDKNHMLLGSRPTRLYPEILKASGKYCDAFSTSAYSLNQGYRVNPEFEETIAKIYEHSKKPIFLGVLIAAKDAGLPYGIVKTQRDRGISYWRYLAAIAQDPRIVGVHWFQYFDPPLKCFQQKVSNWGLVDEKDEPYEEAVNLIKEANKMVYAYALGLSRFVPEFDSLLGIIKKETPEISRGPLKTITIPISNSGFEQGKRDWALQAWKGKSKSVIDSQLAHSGNKSLKIQGGPDAGWGSIGVGVKSKLGFVLKPGYQYKLSAWIKTQNVEDSAFVRIKVTSQSGGDDYFGTEGVYGTEKWKYVEVEFSPREENSVQYLAAQLVGKGTAWFDDIRLEVLASEDASIEDFSSENRKQSTDDQSPIVLNPQSFNLNFDTRAHSFSEPYFCLQAC